ncbi:MAG TPA: type II toxin-antitoxin system RelE/ParE family toxin [bacterium]|nr:type II toxin-antitoxin system RelE/ParE family toxin [bacterium]HPN31375.1 type II toxin-antitoxin system RelE/ParE family toxin [bacterium]
MKLQINYSKNANKFILKNQNILDYPKVRQLINSAINKIYNIESATINLKPLKGNYKGYWRIRCGDIRIIFTVKNDEIFIVFIQDIGFRCGIY